MTIVDSGGEIVIVEMNRNAIIAHGHPDFIEGLQRNIHPRDHVDQNAIDIEVGFDALKWNWWREFPGAFNIIPFVPEIVVHAVNRNILTVESTGVDGGERCEARKDLSVLFRPHTGNRDDTVISAAERRESCNGAEQSPRFLQLVSFGRMENVEGEVTQNQ
jgi:hypothetical protein